MLEQKETKMQIPNISLDDLFSTQEQRDNANLEKIINIKIDDILSQEKPNQVPKLKFSEERIRSVLPKNVENKDMEDFVIKAIAHYSKYLKQKDLGAR